jgi:hypothetical protein
MMMPLHSVLACLLLPLVVASFFQKPQTMPGNNDVTEHALHVIPVKKEATLSPPPSLLLGSAYRLSLLSTGITLGLITSFPNIMISDPGTRLAGICANIGICASALFCAAGIVGAVAKKSCL